MTAPDPSPPSSAALPALRPELRLLTAEAVRADRGGTLFDPLRGRYFRLDEETLQLLSLWPLHRTADSLIAAAEQIFGLHLSTRQIEQLQTFLATNELLVPEGEDDWRRLVAVERRGRHGPVLWLVHNYLFVRLPLLSPEPMLRLLAPLVARLMTRRAAAVVALLGVAGLYLVSRQWDAFLGTFPHLFSWQGALLFAIALGVVKSLHELGHACVAARYGCRVPSAGVCFMVLVPMLYTDVSDAWRLASPRKRMAIDAAGVVVELAIACAALFLWAFLPEGPARSLCFALATTSAFLSLGLNLNPFMRFDGYYLLCDLTGIENLQPRAFALGVWRLRELLFKRGVVPPERFARRTEACLVAYAWAIWIYRMVLFTGIAVLVYHMAFKVLGLALFLIEIVFFIALPIWRELREWRAMGVLKSINARTCVTASLAVLAVVGACLPLSTRVAIPAVIEDAEIRQIYPKRAGFVVSTAGRLGAPVAAGDVIVDLVSPDLEHELRLTRERITLVEWRLRRLATDAAERSEALVLQDQLRSLQARHAGLMQERSELRIVADHAGVIAELDPDLHVGRWLQRGDLVALIRGGTRTAVRGYIEEGDIGRVDLAAPARFIPDRALGHTLDVRMKQVAPTGTAALALPDLASHYGGPIAARPQQAARNEGRVLAPVVGQFLVDGVAINASDERRVLRGVLIAEARSESLATRMLRQVLKVLVREAGL